VKRIFARISQTYPKCFVLLLPTNFLPQRSWRAFLVWPPQRGLHVFFCKRWVPFFKDKKHWAPFVPGFLRTLTRFSGIFPGFSWILPNFSGILSKFSGILPEFLTNKKFWGALAPPAPCTTAHACFGIKAFWREADLDSGGQDRRMVRVTTTTELVTSVLYLSNISSAWTRFLYKFV